MLDRLCMSSVVCTLFHANVCAEHVQNDVMDNPITLFGSSHARLGFSLREPAGVCNLGPRPSSPHLLVALSLFFLLKTRVHIRVRVSTSVLRASRTRSGY